MSDLGVSSFSPESSFSVPQFGPDSAAQIDRNLRQISAVERTWRLPALPDGVKLDLAAMPGVDEVGLSNLLTGLDTDLAEDEVVEEPSLYTPRDPVAMSGMDQFRTILAGVAGKKAPKVVSTDAVMALKERAIREGLLDQQPQRIDSSWSPEMNRIRGQLAYDDYNKAMRGDRHGAMPLSGAMKILNDFTSPAGLLSAATDLDLWIDAGAVKREFSSWGDKWRELGESKNPLDFAGNLVDALTGPIDEIVLPIVNVGLLFTGVGAVANTARIGWMGGRAARGASLFSKLYGGASTARNLEAIGEASWTAQRLMRSSGAIRQGIGKGMAAWRDLSAVKGTKAIVQQGMRLGFTSQVEDRLPGYQGGVSLRDVSPEVDKLASGRYAAGQSPALMPLEVLVAPYNIWTPGTFLRQGGEGANVISRTIAGAGGALGSLPGRAAAGGLVGTAAGVVAGEDAGDIARGAVIGAGTAAVLPSAGRALSNPIARDAVRGAVLGGAAGVVLGDDPQDVALGALAGMGLVSVSSTARRTAVLQGLGVGTPIGDRFLQGVGSAFTKLSFQPLADDQKVAGSFDKGMRRILADDPQRLAEWESDVVRSSVMGALAKQQGGDIETAAATIGFATVSAAIDYNASSMAGVMGAKGWRGRYHMARNKLVNQLRSFDLSNPTEALYDDLAASAAWTADGVTSIQQAYRKRKEIRQLIDQNPRYALEVAATHNATAAETMRQLMSAKNMPDFAAADDMASFGDEAPQAKNLLGDFGGRTDTERASILESYMPQIADTFGNFPRYAEVTTELRDVRVAGLLDAATFVPAKNRRGRAIMPVQEYKPTKVSKSVAGVNRQITEILLDGRVAPDLARQSRFTPFAAMHSPGRVTVMKKGTATKQDLTEFAEQLRDLRDASKNLQNLKSSPWRTDLATAFQAAGVTEDVTSLSTRKMSTIIKHLPKSTSRKSAKYMLGYARHHGLSLDDLDVALSHSLDDILADTQKWERFGVTDQLLDDDGRPLSGFQLLDARIREVNERINYTAAEVDVDALLAYTRENGTKADIERLENMAAALDRDGYKLAHGVEFLMPEDLAHGPVFGDATARHLNAVSFGNFFRGKEPIEAIATQDRRRRLALVEQLSKVGKDLKPDDDEVSNILNGLRQFLEGEQDKVNGLLRDMHMQTHADRFQSRLKSSTTPVRLEDLGSRQPQVLTHMEGLGYSRDESLAIWRATHKFRNTDWSDVGLYKIEAKLRSENQVAGALKLLSGTKYGDGILARGRGYRGAGAAIGGVQGYQAADPDASWDEKLALSVAGGAIGGAIGSVAPIVAGKSGLDWLAGKADNWRYGYLADNFARLRDSFRFTLSPFFDISRYCLAPETKVLTGDLRWVEVGSLEVGDHVAGFDEHQPGPKNSYRKWRNAHVTATGRDWLPSYRVTLADGTQVVSSEQHMWLMVHRTGTNKSWLTTAELFERFENGVDTVDAIRLVDVWDADDTRVGGYLAGMFDGEGSISTPGLRISLAQRENSALSAVESALADLGFGASTSLASGGSNKDVATVYVKGGLPEHVRFLGQVRPRRLLDCFQKQGGIERLNRLTIKDRVPIAKVEFLGVREVVTLGTSTKTLVAEGFAHHNTEGLMLSQTAAPLRRPDGSRLTLPFGMSPRGLRKDLAKKFVDEGMDKGAAQAAARSSYDRTIKEFNNLARGRDYDPDALDSMGQWFRQVGIMGFSPTDWMGTAFARLRQEGFTPEQAYDAAREMYTYGTRGRSAAELSVNTIFFPFSFQKKALTHIGKWMNDDLGRSIMIHDALKTYEILDETYNLDEYWRDHMPFMQQLQKLNLFAYGLSPGRLGGMNAQLLEATGKVAWNMFVPVGMEIKDAAAADEAQKVLKSLMPAMNDINWMIENVKDSGHVMFSEEHVTRRAQVTRGYEAWNEFKRGFEAELQTAGFGFGDLDRPWMAEAKAFYEGKRAELADRYPEWWASRQEYVSDQMALNTEKQLREDRVTLGAQTGEPVSLDDQQFVQFEAFLDERQRMMQLTLRTSDFTDAPPGVFDEVHAMAKQFADQNPAFLGLWRKYWQPTFGPIEMALEL